MQVRRYPGLEALPGGYRELFNSAGEESFFNSALWYRVLLATTIAPGDEIRFYGVEEAEGKRALALLPACRSGEEAAVLGARMLSGCHSIYSMNFSPLMAPDLQDRRGAIDALVDAVAEDRPRWDAVSLRLLDRDSDVFYHFLDAFKRRGMTTEPYFQYGNWYEEVTGLSFDGYLASRGKSIRKTVARAARHFDDRSDGGYEMFAGQGDLEKAFAGFKEVYGASWKTEEQHPAFIERLIRDCAEDGSLRLANLYLDSRPVATWLVIVSHGTAVLLKTAYDSKLPGSLSVGGVLTFKVLQHLLDVDHVGQIDFGIGDESYKSKWLSERRERWGIVAYNRRTAKGALLAAMVQGRSWCRKALRRNAAE